MRVIAGEYGGRRLKTPQGTATRPTADRVKEALFSILGPLDDLDVLDLFAGSGALGLEALSRGAEGVTFVDRAAPAVRAVEANLEALGATATVHHREATAFIRDAAGSGRQYDLVLLDPPYGDAEPLGAALADALPAVLARDGRVASESDRRAPLTLPWPLLSEHCYGDTLIRIHAAP